MGAYLHTNLDICKLDECVVERGHMLALSAQLLVVNHLFWMDLKKHGYFDGTCISLSFIVVFVTVLNLIMNAIGLKEYNNIH